MRRCVRCNTEMIDNCGIKVKGAAYGLVLTDDENKWWGGRMEQPKVAICPKCGEVSIYLENVEKLHEFLYPKSEYTVSDTVRDIAKEIESLNRQEM